MKILSALLVVSLLALAVAHDAEARCKSTQECPATSLCVEGSCVDQLAEPSERTFLLAVHHAVPVGLDGSARNPVPGHLVGLELGFGGWIRYHLIGGFSSMNAYEGMFLSPLAFGYPIAVLRRSFTIDVEPVIALLHTEVIGANDQMLLLASTHAWAQAIVGVGPVFVAVSPVGVEYRYLVHTFADGDRDGIGHTAPGTGFNYRFSSSVGLRF